jgi:hypothetical protein
LPLTSSNLPVHHPLLPLTAARHRTDTLRVLGPPVNAPPPNVTAPDGSMRVVGVEYLSTDADSNPNVSG